MISLDTNVVVRFLVDDDAAQARRARALIERSDTLITATVLLECEWVLRSAYRFSPADIQQQFRALLGLPRVNVDDPEKIARALEWYAGGVDFADAIHLSLSERADAFATFDRDLIRIAPRLNGPKMVLP